MQTKYRYEYEQHPARKGTCPACNRANTFRYMRDAYTGERLPEHFGKCDRENNCGYIMLPNKENYSQHYLNKTQSTYKTPNKPMNNQPIQKAKVPDTRIKFIDESVALSTKRKYNANSFILWLQTIFDNDTIKKILKTYDIGTAKDKNGCLFWYRDVNQKLRTAKKMAYNEDGHRDKKVSYYIHGKLPKEQDEEYKLCFFGEHLINQPDNIDKIVAIVESEKTAIIASLYLSHLNCVWLASGSSNGLTDFKMPVLKKRKIILVPDLDIAGRTAYKIKANYYQQQGYNIKVYDIAPHINDGSDLADYLVLEDFRSKFNNSTSINTKVQSNESTTKNTCIELISTYFNGFDNFLKEVKDGSYAIEDVYTDFIAQTGLELPLAQFKISLDRYIAANAEKELPF